MNNIFDRKITINGTQVNVGDLFAKTDHGQIIKVTPPLPGKHFYKVLYEDGQEVLTQTPPSIQKYTTKYKREVDYDKSTEATQARQVPL